VTLPLLPAGRKAEKIGGPGDEFVVAGVKYQCGPNATGHPSALHYGELPGAWRIEESPAESAAEDIFLHVMAVTDAGSKEMPTAEIVAESAEAVTVKAASPSGTEATVTFVKGGKAGASIEVVRDGETLFSGTVDSVEK
jgi:hypothetical protein